MDAPIVNMLEKLPRDRVMFSMPGHKGRLWPSDITEISGADNLLAPEGCIAGSQRLAAAENGAAAAIYSTNGSTGCVLAMFAYLGRGAKVIVARDHHMSAQNAMRICAVRAVFVGTDITAGGVTKPAAAGDIIAAMEENPDAAAVYVTSPNYYGICADIPRIAAACREKDMLLLVDGAHGAHHAYSALLPDSPGTAGADIWYHSYHKTMFSLNQAAVLFAGERADAERLKSAAAAFQTTSPSYPVLASIDSARELAAREGEELFLGLKERIDGFEASLPEGISREENDDFTRLVLGVRGRGVTGFEAAAAIERAGVYPEAADEANLILISTPADTDADFERLLAALSGIPEKHALPRAATVFRLGGGLCDCGRPAGTDGTAAKTVLAYPPGIPLIEAGMTPAADERAAAEHFCAAGYEVITAGAVF